MKKNDNIELSRLELFLRSKIQHYNEQKYWKYRNKVLHYNGKHKIINLFRLFYLKKSDAFNNASTGIHLGYGAIFSSIPSLPHGLYGIVVSHNARVGSNCTIYHGVTIGEGRGGAPTIGNNCILGAGCKIIGKITIGDNVKIAPGLTIMRDLPDNVIVLPGENSIFIKELK